MCNIKNCELTASTMSAIAKRAMKDRGMRITRAFVPAESHYVVNAGTENRFRINLSDNQLTCLQERRIADQWFINGLNEFKGTIAEVQEAFINLVANINKNIK